MKPMTLPEILALAATDPIAAAAELDKLADRLHRKAEELRGQQNPGGVGDRVMVQVLRPNGVKS